MEDINLSKVSPHVVLLSVNKATRIHICQEWQEADKDEDIFPRIITGNESWLLEYKI